MPKLNKEFLEEQLTRRLNKKVELSKGVYYSSEEMAIYRQILIEGKNTGIKFDVDDLTEYAQRGILDKQLDRLAARLSNNGE
jgi:DNA polymerase III alpha subunit (gram-positive type)